MVNACLVHCTGPNIERVHGVGVFSLIERAAGESDRERKERFPSYPPHYGGVGNEWGRERVNKINFHIILCGRCKGVVGGRGGGIPPNTRARW